MTATERLYVRDGSRFVVYDERRQHTPPIPVPVSLADPDEAAALELLGDAAEPDGDTWDPDAQPTRDRPVVRTGPQAWRFYAPRCPHGHFRACRVKACPGAQ